MCKCTQGTRPSYLTRFVSNHESVWDFWLETETGGSVDISVAAFFQEEQIAHQAVLARMPSWTAVALGTTYYGSWHF